MIWKQTLLGHIFLSAEELDEFLATESTSSNISGLLSEMEPYVLFHYLKLFVGQPGYEQDRKQFFAAATQPAKDAIEHVVRNFHEVLTLILNRRFGRSESEALEMQYSDLDLVNLGLIGCKFGDVGLVKAVLPENLRLRVQEALAARGE